MPITITLPESLNKKTAASRLSSRKLLDIARDIAVTKNERDIQSAILELQQRKHYLPELAAHGALSSPLTADCRGFT
jgi:hypothetical protein